MFPKYQEIQLPLLIELSARGGKSRPSEKNDQQETIYEALARHFNLSSDELNVKIYENNGAERSKWENMIRWARNDLKKQGYLMSSDYGIWEISEAGKKVLEITENEKVGKRIFTSNMVVSPSKFQDMQEKANEIGKLGEEFVMEYEQRRLTKRGYPDLAKRVKQISLENVAAGYDILSYDFEGKEKYIEVKTSSRQGVGFELTINEFNTAKKHGDAYWIYRVTNINSSSPKIIEIQNPEKLVTEKKLLLRPSSFSVVLGETFSEL